jgi:hypothetical protein
MKASHQPSGLQRGLSFIIDANWTPAQALAVYELLDDLRERIWLAYALEIQALLKQQCTTDNPTFTITDDPPF